MDDTQSVLISVTSGKEIPIGAEMLIGRLDECDLQLSEGQASRRHARLYLTEEGAWLEDLGSANGTFVNGVLVATRVRLNPGDRVRFDVEEFDFRGPEPMPIPEPELAPMDLGKTVFRAPEPAPVRAERSPPPPVVEEKSPDVVAEGSPALVAESSGMYKRPGAWADPDAMGDAGNKTKFIDPAQLKEMIDAPAPDAMRISAMDGPHLQVASGSRTGLNIRMAVGEAGAKEWTIGCQEDRDIQFQDSGVSALHAKIVNEGLRWKVLDQMSANGTFVNGKRSNVSYLTDGDRIRFGPVECIFHTAGSGLGGSFRDRSEKSGSNVFLIGTLAFIITIVVLIAIYEFVL